MRPLRRPSLLSPRRPVWAAALAAVALAAAPARADDWPTPGLDAAHARLSPERSGAAFADGKWSFVPAGDAGALASPVAADGVLVSAA
ncbi:MAG TPA: hypothetical protein VHO06_02360, partial [Polyangia bacterium]|nr:hypothetical protein [Polyangia bacterium]